MAFEWPKGDTHFHHHGEYKHYQAKSRQLFESHIESTDRMGSVIDIGAHAGSWTCELATRYPQIYAFEPIHYQLLLNNVEALGLDNVNIIAQAVSNTQGFQDFYVRLDNSGDCGFEAHEAHTHTQYVSVTTVDAHEYMDPVGIKIDTQGHELEVLQGATRTLEQYKPTLCIESPTPAVREFLSTHKYTQVAHRGKDTIWKHQKLR